MEYIAAAIIVYCTFNWLSPRIAVLNVRSDLGVILVILLTVAALGLTTTGLAEFFQAVNN